MVRDRDSPTHGRQQIRHHFSGLTHLFRPRILPVRESSSESSTTQIGPTNAVVTASTSITAPLLPQQALLSARAPVPSSTATLTEASTATKPATLGTIELCSGGPNPEIDIFFVHGLMGDAYRTWEKKGVLWPKQLLGEAFPQARIFTYGYDADVVKLFSRVGQGTIYQQSRSLIQAVHRARRDHYRRPIIFIAHSLGGILVKDGLNWAKAQTGFSAVRVNEVFSATKGVIFLGTPHRGASGQYAEVGEQLRRLVGIFLHSSNSHLLSSLKSDSETLPRISEDFHRLCDESPFLVFSFVETLPITNIKGIGLVVDHNSGYMGLTREEKDVIDANHMEMARFSSRNDAGYKIVEDAVRHCINAATQDTASQTAGDAPSYPDANYHELIYEFTANSQYLTDIQLLRSGRLEGTCEWISDQVSFQSWVSGTTKFLLLVGAAGSGKSHVLAKAIDILDERFGKPRLGDTSTPLIAFLFCRTPNKKQTLLNGLKSIIGQLAHLDDAYAKELSTLWERQQAHSKDSAPTISWLWHNLLSSSQALCKRMCIFLVVDGLDECEPAERREFLDSVYAYCTRESKLVIRLFCSGRPEVKTDMTQIMNEHISSLDVPTIEISWQTAKDINMLIERKMTRVKFFRDKQLRAKVQTAISSDAKGMFLWADLTLKEFINAKTNVEVEACLARMKTAQTLNDMYHGLMHSLTMDVSELQLDILQNTLIWLLFGTEVLSYSLLQEAIERKVRTKIFAFPDEIERFGSIIEVGGFQRLRLSSASPDSKGIGSNWVGQSYDNPSPSLLPDLGDDDDIYFDDGTGITGNEIVRIRHITFQEWYFSGLGGHSHLWISPQDAHIHLATTCLDVLVCVKESSKDHPRLFDYAVNNWHEHLLRVDWMHAPQDKLSDYVSKLHVLFTDWDIAKSWLRHVSFIKWGDISQDLDASIRKILQRFSNLDITQEGHRLWADDVSSSPENALRTLVDTIINTAEARGFFDTFPRIGEEVADYFSIMSSMLFFFEIASRNVGLINTPHAAFLSAWNFWKPRAAFWKHRIWAKHPDTKEYATAGLNWDDNFEAKITGYLAAFQVKPEEPIISFALSSLHLRQSDPNEALPWAQRATQMCRNDKPASHDCLAQYLLLEADIYNALGSRDIALDKYNQAVELGNTTALDLLASHYARIGDAGSLAQWLDLYLKYEDGSGDGRGNNFANAVLRQPVFSEWHTTFGRAIMELKQPGLQIQAYTKAIRLDKAKRGAILTQCGCRFHLAKALAHWPSQRAKAIPLRTWILNNVTRSRIFQRRQGSAFNWLFLLTIEELSLSQALTLDHPLVSFAENTELSLWEYSRILVCLGKSIEQQRHQSEAAGQLYRRVLQRVLNTSRQAGFIFDDTLGNILLALGNLDDAARALSWSCMYGDPDDEEIPFDSNVSSTSEDETKLVSAQTTVKATSKPQSLHMRISWRTLCDMCAAKSNYSTNVDIFGYRYKCCICSEVDLCELCYLDWKDSGDKEMLEAMRHCEPSHTFLKLPSPLWPEVEWEVRQIRARQMPESVRAWLDELVIKYDLQDHR